MKTVTLLIVGFIVLINHTECLSQVTETLLAEDNSFVISSMSGFSVSPDGKLITFCDRSSGNLYVYQYIDGSLHSAYMPSIQLSDSIAMKGVYPKKNKKLAFIRELIGKDGKMAPQHVISASLSNQFHVSKFINDSLVACIGQFFCMVKDVSTVDSIIKGRATFGGIVVININKKVIVSCSPCEYGGLNTFVQTSTLLPLGEDSLILPVANYDAVDNMGYDSAWTLAMYSISGSLRSYINSFPHEGVLYNLMYSNMDQQLCRDSSGSILCTFQSLPYIYNISTNKKIHLDNLVSKNDIFFEKVKSLRLQKSTQIQWDSLYLDKPFFVTSVESTGDSYYVILANRLQLNPWRVLRSVHKYNMDGIFVKKIEFSQIDLPNLQNLFYDAKNKLVVQAIKASNGWKLLKMKWE